jgi:hypothetical protein
MNLADGKWFNEFPCPLYDTGKKVPGFPPWRKRTLYEYRANDDAPMTFHIQPDIYIRPDRHGFTDMGSVPEFIQLIIPKDLHNPSFVLHDSGCREHGLYFSKRYEGPYTFSPMSSRALAKLLGQGLYAAGYTIRARHVYRAVRRFGPQFDVGG